MSEDNYKTLLFYLLAALEKHFVVMSDGSRLDYHNSIRELARVVVYVREKMDKKEDR